MEYFFHYPKSLNISCYSIIITNLKRGLMMKKELLTILMVISMFLISACDVYNTLYVKQPGIQGEAVEIPEGNITVKITEENIMDKLETEEETAQGMKTAEEI